MKKQIVLAGLVAAMVCAATSMLVITIPGGSGGYVHLGDTVIYLAAALLPVPYAVAAAAIGASLADFLMMAPAWTPFTIAIKAVMAMTFTAKKETLMCRRNAVAPVLAGLVCVAGYYGAQIALACASGSSFAAAATAAAVAIPFNGAQALASGICFVVLALSLDKLGIKKRLQKM